MVKTGRLMLVVDKLIFFIFSPDFLSLKTIPFSVKKCWLLFINSGKSYGNFS